jgi:hypothetical protein
MSARAAHARSSNPSSNVPPQTTPTEHKKRSERSQKTRSAQPVQAPRRESVQTGGATAGRPGNLKIRAYSAPMVPKYRVAGAEQDHEGDLQAGDLEPGEDITDDPFFREYDFPQTGPGEKDNEESSSSADSSSDTEGPLSPTHLKNRQQQAFADSQTSPRSPVPSVAVGFFSCLTTWQTSNADVCAYSLETATLHPPCRTSI